MSSDPTPLFDGLRFPGEGMAERVTDTLRPLAPWARLCHGQGLGKRSVINYDNAVAAAQRSPVEILDVQGDDRDATPIAIVLGPPTAIPRELADVAGQNIQVQTGEFNNANVGVENYPGTALPIAWPPIIAVIQWGVGGARFTAFVDFVQGMTVNLGPASAVRVWAAIPPDAIHEPGNSGMYAVSAFVGPGKPRDGSAQRTIYAGAIEAGSGGDVFAVPPFAKRVTVIGLDVAAPNVTVAYITFYRSPDGTNPVGSYIVNGNQPLPFNVPNGAAYYVIANGLADTQRFAACFDLAI